MGEKLGRVLPKVIRQRYMARFAMVLGIVILVMAAAGGLLYFQIAGQLTEGTQSDMETTVDDEAAELAQWVETNEQTARMLSSYGAMTANSTDEIETTLSMELSELPDETAAVHYVDFEEGAVITSTDESAVGMNIHDQDIRIHVRDLDFDRYFGEHSVAKEVATDETTTSRFSTTYSNPYERDGNVYVAFLSPITDETGTTDLAVMMTVDATGVAERFHTPIDGGYKQVVNTDNGDILFAEDHDALLEQYDSSPTAEEFYLDDEDELTGTFECDDTDEVVAYAGVDRTDWMLVSHAPQDNAYALADSVLNTVVVLLAVVFVGFLAVGGTVGRTTARSLDDLASQARAISEGELETDATGRERSDEIGDVQEAFGDIQSYLQTIANQAGAIANQEFDEEVLNESVPGEIGDALERMNADLQRFVDELETAQQRAQRRSNTLQSEAEAISKTMAVAATGDFTKRLDPTFDTEAMNEIARSYNEMAEELEEAIHDAKALAGEVDNISREVQTGAEEIDQTSDEVSRAAEEISAATTEQTGRFNEVLEEMNDLSATIEEIASTSQEVASVSNRVDTQADDASSAADAAIADMEELAERATVVTNRVDTLDQEISEVEELVDVIDDIAEQTNMLALNASVEAARANNADGGFAVVAEEIKTLAEETAEATQEAERLIESVQNAADDTADDIHKMQSDVKTSVNRVESTLRVIEDIATQIEELNSSIQAIDEATNDQAAASQEVVTMLDGATEQSKQTDTEAEQVAAATEEQTAAIKQISTAAQSLADHSQTLHETMEEFEVRESTDRSDTET